MRAYAKHADSTVDPTKVLREFHALADTFSKSDEPADREATAERMVNTWGALRDVVAGSPLATEKLSMMEDSSARLAAAASADAEERADALATFTSAFERVANVAATIGTPAEPGARWRPEKPPLDGREKQARLEKVHDRTKGTARSLADAVRKVIRARREEGVPLHSTFYTQVRADYAMAVTDHAMGFTPMAPYSPPTTKRTAPWGVFRVRTTVLPAGAAARFAVSPPLPARGELLESKFTRIRLAPLHRDAAGPDGANHPGEPENAEP